MVNPPRHERTDGQRTVPTDIARQVAVAKKETGVLLQREGRHVPKYNENLTLAL